MSRSKAVSSLDDIKARCVEVGDCWEWAGAMSNKRSPIAAIPTQHPLKPGMRAVRVGVAVLAWEAANKKAVGSMLVYRTCFNRVCVNPAHLKCGTHAQMSETLAKAGKCKRKPAAIAAITRAKRSTVAKLTIEQAREIRASTDTTINLAGKYGINKSLVSRIKRGDAWRESVAVASIFSIGHAT
ncbi:MAG: hypothetical protein KGI52_11675 [Burkholderiales bacterium]|nr:hypothetical protein [Burkholderiales bacterium]